MLRGMAARDVLPQALKLARTARGFTQVKLERAGDLPNGLISDLEHGRRRPRVAQLRQIAAALGVEPFTELCEAICAEAFARVAAEAYARRGQKSRGSERRGAEPASPAPALK